MASIVAAADRDTRASIRSGWYSYSSVAGRQAATDGATVGDVVSDPDSCAPSDAC